MADEDKEENERDLFELEMEAGGIVKRPEWDLTFVSRLPVTLHFQHNQLLEKIIVIDVDEEKVAKWLEGEKEKRE